MSEEQLNENSVVVQGLDPGHVYEFRVVAVDGRFETPSAVQDIHTYAHLPSASDRGSSVLSSSGWFIGMCSTQIQYARLLSASDRGSSVISRLVHR